MSTRGPGHMPSWARPIRIPDDVEITHAEPPCATAAARGLWELPFRLSRAVRPGALLKLQLWGGRNNKGSFPEAQTTKPGAAGYVSARLDDGTELELRPDPQPGTFVVSLPDGGLERGRGLTVTLGGKAGRGQGIRACSGRQLNKFCLLYALAAPQAEGGVPAWAGGDVWSKATADRLVAACTLHLLGGATDHLRAIVPASTRPGVPFAVLVRPEDESGYLSPQTPGPLTVALAGAVLPSRATAVPESSCVRLWVTLPEAGVWRLTVRDAAAGREAVSNPTVCSAASPPVFWGMIHGHTEMSDGTGSLEQYFHQLRHEVGLDFAATADHDHRWETPDEFWQATCAAVKRWHRPQEFVALLGYEWAKWRRNGDGDRNVYYPDDDQPLFRSDEGEYPSPPDLFAALRRQGVPALVIPHHTGHGGNFCDWKDHSPEHERLVEIFQMRGSYECAPEEGNPVPEKVAGPEPYPEGYVQHALALGWRVGFTAGGDDHAGHWGTEVRFGSRRTGYKQGLMSVAAAALTRPALFAALHERRVVATTGARLLLSFSLADRPLGSELRLRDDPGLATRRHLAVDFHGTAPLARLDILRNNGVVHALTGNGELDLAVTWDDTAPLAETWLPPARFCPHPFTFYYVRVVQSDGEVGWASPVWIDP